MAVTDERNEASPEGSGVTRREFLVASTSALGAYTFGSLTVGCSGDGQGITPTYRIESTVYTTVDRMLSFPYDLSGLVANQIDQVAQFASFGYGTWTYGAGLPVSLRTDLVPSLAGQQAFAHKVRMARFFTISDIHITDKEAPNQLIWFQQYEPQQYADTSIYSPVMLYTTHVLDAAVQTINAIHRQDRFDFGLSLGDTCNSSSYLELRWYIDVLDGGWIEPSSGAHAGAGSIDYQKPYWAEGLDPDIPWYQVMGNHDHFFLGSFPIDAFDGCREAYTAGTVWAVGDALVANEATFPVLIDYRNFAQAPKFYAGTLDGSTPYGDIVAAGSVGDAAFASGAPAVVADPKRRALNRRQWVGEFYKTRTTPAGHGFNHVDRKGPYAHIEGFTCYSFVPDRRVPLKIIVLDDTQSETDGSYDIHGHGYLDADRWAWLQAELADGQAKDQLMIVAAHVPLAVAAIGSEFEWWLQTSGIAPEKQNAVTLTQLVQTLQSTPNLLLWAAGHRHCNTVKAFPSPDPARPELGFWQVETSALREFPQQFRTFDVWLNEDDTVSVVSLNVDTAPAPGSPAAISRTYAVAVQQIVKSNQRDNNANVASVGSLAVPTMDPTRPQDGTPDPSIRYDDLTAAVPPVPYHASCNVELVKALDPALAAKLRALPFATRAR